MRRTRAAALGAAALAALLVRCRDASGPERVPAAESITAEEMGSWIAALADDSLLGRATPGPTLVTAAAAMVARFQQLGLAGPFAGGGHLQWFDAAAPPGGCCDAPAPNVAAVLPGGDSDLSDEWVVYVAHLDHIGTPGALIGCTAQGADTVCNGADDNASGVAAVLEIADAFVRLPEPPRRSVLFLLVSGEERGLWGSQHFVSDPPVPVAQIVAVINLDMIGRNAADQVYVGGLGYSSLGEVVAGQAGGRSELGLRVREGPTDRSDHVPFAQQGVPFLFFHTGLHEDYHRPSDEPARLDADKAARVARLAFHTGLAVAGGQQRPHWYAASARAGGWGRP